ncbi:hypothetical protein JTE90_011864 [Oedothorax gibbosus]|uniref:Uncharacterized protein n=1 Tax=Oedothorax gibbosus TaxID=931172 RepID=A0AAV6V5J0_9ARAC|nr:hypothetical protein JTE90_011864 [Oedothorax gibbosus]
MSVLFRPTCEVYFICFLMASICMLSEANNMMQLMHYMMMPRKMATMSSCNRAGKKMGATCHPKCPRMQCGCGMKCVSGKCLTLKS